MGVGPYRATAAKTRASSRSALACGPSALVPSLVVVGAGVFGAALRASWRSDGWDVTLVEPVAPGHVRAGSGDESRLIRCSTAPTRGTRARPGARWALWHEIDPGWSSRRAWRGSRAATTAGRPRARRRLRAVGIPCERVDAAELFPSVATDDVASRSSSPRPGSCARATRVGRSPRRPSRPAPSRLAAARPDGARVVLGDGGARGRPRRVGVRRVAGAALPRPARPAHHPAGRPVLRRRRGLAHARRAGLGRLRRRGLRPGRPRRARRQGRARRRGPADATPRRASASPCPSTRARARLSRACASRPWRTRRSSAIARASTRSRPTPTSSSPRIPSTRSRVADGRRLGPRLQARAGAGRALRALAERAAAPEPRFGLGERSGDVSLRTARVRKAR